MGASWPGASLWTSLWALEQPQPQRVKNRRQQVCPSPSAALYQSLTEISKVDSWALTTHPRPQVTEVTVLREAGSLGSCVGGDLGYTLFF